MVAELIILIGISIGITTIVYLRKTLMMPRPELNVEFNVPASRREDGADYPLLMDHYLPPPPLTAPKKMWSPMQGLFVHQAFHHKGICVVASSEGTKKGVANEESFYYNDRQFFFENTPPSETKKRPQHKAFQSATLILDKLILFCESSPDTFKRTKREFLFNLRHRDEAFVPIALGNVGLYVYPWIAQNPASFKFNGIKKFHSAGCLFGSFLCGMSNKFGRKPLVDHQLKLKPGEKIVRLVHPTHIDNPYEIMLFSELEKTAQFIQHLSKPTERKTLYFHLPALDYILFGLELYIKGQIDREPLEHFVQLTLAKRAHYIRQITARLAEKDIDVIFYSPFDNLVPIDLAPEAWLLHLLRFFNIDETAPTETLENVMVAQTIAHLTQATGHNHSLIKTWQDFISYNHSETIMGFDVLFKIANAVAIGAISIGNQPFEICSILPLSEKQIQLKYTALTKPQKDLVYPSLLNLTLLEPIIAYSSNAKVKGSLFYFSEELPRLSSLLAHGKILEASKRNIYGFFEQSTRASLRPPIEPSMNVSINIQE